MFQISENPDYVRRAFQHRIGNGYGVITTLTHGYATKQIFYCYLASTQLTS